MVKDSEKIGLKSSQKVTTLLAEKNLSVAMYRYGTELHRKVLSFSNYESYFSTYNFNAFVTLY